MKVVIAGGSGQIGMFLARHFLSSGNEVVILSRAESSGKPWRTVRWNARDMDGWVEELNGTDVLINLAGRNVNCRYTEENRREIMDSRVQSTEVLGQAANQCRLPPKLWLQSSTATIYAHRFDAPNDEETGIIGGKEADAPAKWGFSIKVAQAWEQSFNAINLSKTRKIILRSAIVLSPDRGGIFDVMLGLVQKGLGGASGSGRQYISWIHDHDFVAAMDWLINNQKLEGVFNISSPSPLPNAQFMQKLREAWGTNLGLPATDWMIELGALFLQTESELVLKSRRVIPGRLLAGGFQFQFPEWTAAAENLCKRWREQNLR